MEVYNSEQTVAGSLAVLIGGVSLWSLGNATGVYLIGNIGDETGSFRVTWLGSILGIVIGTALICF